MKTVRTSTIIFTLFGAYVNPRGGEIRIRNLIELVKPLGLSENAIRLALSRMMKQGLLRKRKVKRDIYYSLSKKGDSLMLGGKRHALEKEQKRWDKKWRLLVYTIPESLRHLRDTLRNKLISMGFGSLGSSLWISPYDFNKKLSKLFRELKVTDYVETFEANYKGLHDSKKLTARAWDIKGLEKQYKEYLLKYNPLLTKYKRNIKNKKKISPGDCFAHRFRLTAEYIDISLNDPMLPQEILPANWVGLKAKNICIEYWKLLTPDVKKFVDSIFGD